MRQITITMSDDGQLTVEADGQEPYQCSTTEECLEYVEAMLKGEESTDEMPSGDMAAMWDEEAAKRPENPNLMR